MGTRTKDLGREWFRPFLVLLALLVASTMAFAAGPKTTDKVYDPATVGMDGKILSDGIERIVTTYIDNKTIPGAVVLVARHGKICYYKAFGQMQDGVPMKKDAIFSLVSMSKSPIAAAAMQLVDQGKILLSDPISLYVPEFANMTVAVKKADGSIGVVPANRAITLHDLLTMTTGIFRPVNTTGDRAADAYTGDPVKDFVGEMMRDAGVKTGTGDYDLTIKQNAALIAKIPLVSQPGTAFVYTDPAADVLGYVLEAVSGMPLDKLLQQNLYAPLGMTDSSFYPSAADASRLPSMWWGGGPGTPKGSLGSWWARTQELGGYGCCPLGLEGALGKNKKWFSGAGGIFSTAYDFYRFGQMLLNGGTLDGKRVLSTQAVKQMTTNQIGSLANNFWDNRWGYMLDLQEDNVVKLPNYNQNGAAGAFGWMGAAGTRWYANPEEDTVIVFMSQLWFLWNIIPATDRIVHVVNRSIQ
jgi:CubicO group peptidase (beta-lactamase class C family)